jgi:superfamily II DNA/RNA helicase
MVRSHLLLPTNKAFFMTSFSELGLAPHMQRVVDAVQYREPTPIQEHAIPLILEGNDLIAQAQTGTGKTAAFALPILQMLNELDQKTGAVRALVLAPTRELAQQVATAFNRYAQAIPRAIRATSIIGGEDIVDQLDRLDRGVDIVVATPGRLLELIREDEIDFDELRFLVIDEADKLLDLGFAEELELLLQALPAQRQNLLFSATYPDKVLQLSEQVMQNPIRVTVDSDIPTVTNITQRVIEVNSDNRGPLLRHLINEEAWDHVLIFVSSKRAAHNLALKLKRDGIRADAFHGDLDQEQRMWVLGQFKKRKIKVLIATDIAARGIDIQNLACVINYDLPRSPADYIHRIGRTGRAGSSGIAISFIGHADQDHFALIEKRARLQLEREQIPGFELTGEAPARRKGEPPVKGKRPNKKEKARAAARENRTRQDD